MRILATSDLHYNIKRSKEPARDVARRVVNRGGDIFILAGDIAGVDSEHFLRGLELFSGFTAKKLLVAGNHDLWIKPGECSFEKWSKRLPQLAAQAGFTMLDHEPTVIGDLGFVGNVGWYAYGFRDDRLAIPMRFYQAKVAPGRAARLSEYHHLLDPVDPILPQHHAITTAWRDGEYVRLSMSDLDFVDYLAGRLERHLAQIEPRCRKIIAVMHHLPHRDLVWYRGDANWDFAAAFLAASDLRMSSIDARIFASACPDTITGPTLSKPEVQSILASAAPTKTKRCWRLISDASQEL